MRTNREIWNKGVSKKMTIPATKTNPDRDTTPTSYLKSVLPKEQELIPEY